MALGCDSSWWRNYRVGRGSLVYFFPVEICLLEKSNETRHLPDPHTVRGVLSPLEDNVGQNPQSLNGVLPSVPQGSPLSHRTERWVEKVSSRSLGPSTDLERHQEVSTQALWHPDTQQ